MKERYFTPENIDSKAQEMLDSIKNIIIKPKFQEFIPEKSALIVIDMQKYFCDESSIPFVPSIPAVIQKIKTLVKAYRKKGLPIIFTRQVNTEENAGMMKKWWKYTIHPEKEESLIIPNLASDSDEILDKSQYDAFHDSALEDILQRKGVSQLVITGLLTHLCCESTARGGFVRGFESFFCVDANATYKEIYHTSSLINLAHGISSLVLCEEIIRKIS